MKNETFRKAALEDADDIWEILRRAIARRKEDGSNQWQDGYPNPEAKKMFGHIEDFAKQNNINSVKADTNFDNPAMLYLFESCGYHFCGTVYFRGSPRKAYEKVLIP